MNEEPPKGTVKELPEFRSPLDPEAGLDDGRTPWDWESKFSDEAKPLIAREAILVAIYLAVFLTGTAFSASIVGSQIQFPGPGSTIFVIDPKLLLILFCGGLGGTTFSIKWLVHSVATGKWHIDRLYWRIFVPLVGGIYAAVVLHLFTSGLIGMAKPVPTEIGSIAAFSFLVGYFSDGVSGLLSNVANAVFGTIERK